MKKLKLLLAVAALIMSLGMNAQAKPEKKAQKFTDEMTQVLSLNEADSKSIYEIQLVRFKESQKIESEFADNPEGEKEKMKALGNKVFNEVKKVLGEERQKKWKDYKENKSKN